MFYCQIPSRIYTLAAAAMPSRTTRQRQQQQRTLTSDRSTLSKLKYWFNKGIQKEQSPTPKVPPNQQRQMEATYIPPAIQTYTNSPARPDLVPPRGPRQLPRAVYAEARLNDRNEVENESISSKSHVSQSTGLTFVQSSRFTSNSRSKPAKNRKPGGGLPISGPLPTKSLLDLTSQYADVQNPQKTYDAARRPAQAGAASTNPPPLYKSNGDGGGRDRRFQPDQPVKEVAKGRAQVVKAPSHQRSQKAMVRKMEPEFARRADDGRHGSHVTVFEDFMGKDPPPPVPALPADISNLIPPSLPSAHRLSRPFREASEFEKPFGNGKDDPSEDISPTTIPISPSASHAQTWLIYDRSIDPVSGLRERSSGVFPRFPPRRNLTKPDATTQQSSRWNACQSCRERFHPSTAVSHNGTYFCQSCAAAQKESPAKEEEAKEEPKEVRYPYAAGTYGKNNNNNNNNKITRKPLLTPSAPPHGPLTPSTAYTMTDHNISGSTLHGSGTPTPPPQPHPQLQRSPRVRRKDIPPEYAHIYTPDAQTPSIKQEDTPTQDPDRERAMMNAFYNTPLPNGTYPRYRTPPPPPITIPPSNNANPTGLRNPAPPSSIYPASSPPHNLGRLSRVPSLPQHPAYDTDAPVPEAYSMLEGKRVQRSDTVASDSSYRAAREEEVIDAYADMYVGEMSPVSPISEADEGRGGWGRAESVVSEFEGARRGWGRR